MNNYEKLKKRHPLRRDIILIIVLLILILVAIIFPRFKDMSEPVEETEIIYIEDKTIFDGPGPKPDIVGYFLQERDEKPIPPEIIEAALDFEWPVLDTFSLDSLYKYEPKDEGPPLPQKNSWQTGGCPIYDKPPKPLTPIEKNLVFPDILTYGDIEGPVVVQAFIDDKGTVQKCIVIKGFPGTGIDEAAIEAIKKTKFKPAVQRDRNVGVWIAIPIIFKLN